LKRTVCNILFLATLLMGVAFTVSLEREARAEERPVAVLISKEIRPFMEMVQGFEQSIDLPVARIFLDKNRTLFSHDVNYKGRSLDNYRCVVAVGPGALSYLMAHSSQGTALSYAMVLNPREIIPDQLDICGVSLNLFSGTAVSGIRGVFPDVKKIGVFFNPDNNLLWFNTALVFGKFRGVEIVPLHVKTQSDINDFFRQPDVNLDALLFIPDRTVSSPTLIKYVIKQAIARKIPVVGYNRFFHQSGAALSFVLDYKGIGRQAAENVTALLDDKKCQFKRPAYGMVLNQKVVDLLGIKTGTTYPDTLEVE